MFRKLFLFFIVSFLFVGVAMPSRAFTQIIVEDAEGDGSVQVYEGMFESAQFPEIPERIITEYAETMYERELSPSDDLLLVLNNIQDRIVVEYAETVTEIPLASDPNSDDPYERIVVEYAETVTEIPLANAPSGTGLSNRIIVQYASAIAEIPLTILFDMVGDVNDDGEVNILDALYIARYAAGLPVPPDFNDSLADVNCDGVIDIVDALLVAQYTAGNSMDGTDWCGLIVAI
jgi:hypothetical protein